MADIKLIVDKYFIKKGCDFWSLTLYRIHVIRHSDIPAIPIINKGSLIILFIWAKVI